jgi:hypothetical protein
MKCPYCGHINDWSEDQCLMCGRDIAYVRGRVMLGGQFVFVEASQEQPIRVTLMPAGGREEEEGCFTQPSIVSRHEYGVKLERRPIERRAPEPGMWEPPPASIPGPGRDPDRPFVLPALDLPALDLMAVTTDRKVYRPGDEGHLFIAAPDAAGREAQLAVAREEAETAPPTRVKLDQAGLALARFADLEAGEYTATLSLPDRPAPEARCTFTCAEVARSPLKAALVSHAFEGYGFSFVLELTQLGAPYDGPLKLVVRNADRVVYEGRARAHAGRVDVDLDLKPLSFGDVTLEMTTPGGYEASIDVPRADWEAWDKISLSQLDPPVEAALAHFHGAEGETRGLHYVHNKPQEHDPFALGRFIATEGQLLARRDSRLVHLLVFDPLSRKGCKLEFQDVKKGDLLRFEVATPYSIFVLGAFMGRALPYEGWGVVLRPVDLAASLDAPEEAAPGAAVSVRVETDRPAHCLLLVHDARLEHESPVAGLARRLFDQIFESTWRLEAGRATQVEWLMQSGLQTLRLQMRLEGKGQPLRLALRQRHEATLRRGASRAILMAPDETAPELAHIELFRVEGRVEVPVQLGDRPGPWRCRAYFFRGHDYVSVTRDIEVVN